MRLGFDVREAPDCLADIERQKHSDEKVSDAVKVSGVL